MVEFKTPIQIYSQLTNTEEKEVKIFLDRLSEIYGVINSDKGYCKIRKEGDHTYLTISPSPNSKINALIGSDYSHKDLEEIIKILGKIKD